MPFVASVLMPVVKGAVLVEDLVRCVGVSVDVRACVRENVVDYQP